MHEASWPKVNLEWWAKTDPLSPWVVCCGLEIFKVKKAESVSPCRVFHVMFFVFYRKIFLRCFGSHSSSVRCRIPDFQCPGLFPAFNLSAPRGSVHKSLAGCYTIAMEHVPRCWPGKLWTHTPDSSRGWALPWCHYDFKITKPPQVHKVQTPNLRLSIV